MSRKKDVQPFSDEGIPVVLYLEQPRLVVQPEVAIQILQLLANSNGKALQDRYLKNEDTGQWYTENRIVPLSMSNCCIKFLSASEYLLFTANGDKSE